MDAVLLFGPLYHLTDRKDRLVALREAHRVLRPGGVLMAVGISRFASALDGLHSGFLKDDRFAEIVRQDLRSGQHRNPTGNPEYFMDTFFHHPDELERETAEAGFSVKGLFGVEGPGWTLPDLDAWWADPALRERILELARTLETEPCMLGVSPHLIVVGKKGD
jgi:SAM-dependent methyltransferase